MKPFVIGALSVGLAVTFAMSDRLDRLTTVGAASSQTVGRLGAKVLTLNNDMHLAEPRGPARVRSTLQLAAMTARVPFGLELAPQVNLGPRVVMRPAPGTISINGMTVKSVLDLIRQVNPDYEWRETETIMEVAPTALLRDSNAPLNHIVPGVYLQGADAATALLAARQALDPSYDKPTRDLYVGPHLPPAAQQQGQRRFSVSFSGGTARELLHTIAVAHGELSWIVEYESPQASVDQMTMTLWSFDGWGISLPPQRKR